MPAAAVRYFKAIRGDGSEPGDEKRARACAQEPPPNPRAGLCGEAAAPRLSHRNGQARGTLTCGKKHGGLAEEPVRGAGRRRRVRGASPLPVRAPRGCQRCAASRALLWVCPCQKRARQRRGGRPGGGNRRKEPAQREDASRKLRVSDGALLCWGAAWHCVLQASGVRLGERC